MTTLTPVRRVLRTAAFLVAALVIAGGALGLLLQGEYGTMTTLAVVGVAAALLIPLGVWYSDGR